MESMEEKIIDLVEVVREGRPLDGLTAEPGPGKIPAPAANLLGEEKIRELVREEVERFFRLTVQDQISPLIREVLAQEAEKALAREIEALKHS